MGHSSRVYIYQKDTEALAQTLSEFRNHGISAEGMSDSTGLLNALKNEAGATVFFDLETMKAEDLKTFRAAHAITKQANSPIFLAAELPYSNDILDLFALEGTRILARPLAAAIAANAVKSHLSEKKANVDYEKGVYKAIEESLQEVLGFYLQASVLKVETYIKKDLTVDAFISSVLSFSGPEHFGSLLVNFDRALIVQLAAAMMGIDVAETPEDDALLDISGEICNQLSSLVAHKITGLGIPIHIGLPKPFLSGHTHYMHAGANKVGAIEFSLLEADEQNSLSGIEKGRLATLEICLDQAA